MGMFSQLAQGVDWSSMGAMALRIVAVLLCLVVHEVCHGLAAYWLGDPTAKQSHRLSLNPIQGKVDLFACPYLSRLRDDTAGRNGGAVS